MARKVHQLPATFDALAQSLSAAADQAERLAAAKPLPLDIRSLNASQMDWLANEILRHARRRPGT